MPLARLPSAPGRGPRHRRLDRGRQPASSVGTVTDSGEIPNGCDAPTGPGTDVPNAITADETWTLEGSPYRVPVNVYLTASITMEACTVVQLAPGVRFLVGNDPAPGAVIARGESIGGVLRPVRFEALDPAAPWATIEVDRTGTLDLEHTQIEGGGGNDVPGMISAWGVDPEAEATPNVRMVDVTLEGSASVGVHLQSRAAFTDDSSGVSIHGSASYPVWIEAGAVHSLPQDLTVGDNADDVVYIDPFTSIDDDTFPDRGDAAASGRGAVPRRGRRRARHAHDRAGRRAAVRDRGRQRHHRRARRHEPRPDRRAGHRRRADPAARPGPTRRRARGWGCTSATRPAAAT
ncbi:MAG: hypothetical protein U0168_23785 [Nannocystaceae bacterium]